MLARDLWPVVESKHEVLALDRSSCDITDEASVRRAFSDWRPQLVVNCAAFPDVDGCEQNPDRAFAVNGRGPGMLARAAENVGGRLFHISTDYVFDGNKGQAYDEDDPTGPINVYGRSKLEGEKNVLERGDHLVIRTSWLYGIHRPNFVESVLAAAQSRDSVEFVEDQISCPTWTVHLSQKIAELAETKASGILHVAGAGQCSRFEFARRILSTLPRKISVAPTTWAKLNRPAKRPLHSALVSRRLSEFELAPLPHWQSALEDYLQLRRQSKESRDRLGIYR